MIFPNNNTRDHILNAINEIDADQIPTKRRSTRWNLVFNNVKYPPKLVICISNKYANGEELVHTNFSGGSEANNFLINRGFTIEEKYTIPESPTQGKKILGFLKKGMNIY